MALAHGHGAAMRAGAIDRRDVAQDIDPNDRSDPQIDFIVGELDLDRIGHARTASTLDFECALLDRLPGQSVPVVVRRGGTEQRIELTLQTAGGSATSTTDLIWRKLGLHLSPIRAELVSYNNRQLHGGLVVNDVYSDGPAAKAGIQRGDVLVGLHQWETLTVDNVQYVITHPELPTFSPLSFYILRQGQVRRGYLANMNRFSTIENQAPS